jgi:glycosyl hydrolase family 59 (putative galactocerebrosidase)
MVSHLFIAIAATALLPVAARAQETPTNVDIAQMPVGGLPSDFTTWRTGQGAPAQWSVVQDTSANGGHAIAQTSQDQTDYRFPLAIYKPVSAKNVEATVRFKPVDGKIDQAGGIAVRLATPDNYYVVRANALEDNVRFYRVVKGNRQQIEGANIKVAKNQWHTLVLKAVDDRFTVSFDGKELYTATDGTFGESGRVALWTKADSVIHFDRFEIKPLP